MDDRGPRLHVTNGDSTAEPLRETGIVGDVIVWMDALHDGPVPDVPRADLRRLRAAFLAGNGWGSADQITADFERRDAALQGALAERRPVVLWFEHDLYDQLQLLEALSLVERPDGVELIVIGAFPGHPGFRGLGELSVGELATLWPGREPLTPAVLDLAHRAWTAVRAPEPGALRAVLRDDTGALPFLAPALRRLLDELPDAAGLSLSERLILQALADGPLTPVELFEVTQDPRGRAVCRRHLGVEGRRRPREPRHGRRRIATDRAHRRGPPRARRRRRSRRAARHRPLGRGHPPPPGRRVPPVAPVSAPERGEDAGERPCGPCSEGDEAIAT